MSAEQRKFGTGFPLVPLFRRLRSCLGRSRQGAEATAWSGVAAIRCDRLGQAQDLPLPSSRPGMPIGCGFWRSARWTSKGIFQQLSAIQRTLLQGTEAEMDSLGDLSDRTGILVDLRELVENSPRWPFTDTAEIARVIVAVASPLVYFILNEIIGIYIIPLLRGS